MGQRKLLLCYTPHSPKHLGPTQRKFQQRIQEREKELQDLRHSVKTRKKSVTHTAVTALITRCPEARRAKKDLLPKENRHGSANRREARSANATVMSEMLYSCELTLDPNTVNRQLHLSEGNREATRGTVAQSYPDHPERFEFWPQVLCREGLTGRCYWEAEWIGGTRIGLVLSDPSQFVNTVSSLLMKSF
ncbi:hypothetical protein JZ751_011330 [Albula glossodonta]|uniref:SPRY-associated domain-containing protein n=1 Tax=Albula glossodonta TaxID=121402 RepID=A0A8T2MWA6_9TELE|nr:hypothetical protein JZ751_011330 [Albula glossodonta]